MGTSRPRCDQVLGLHTLIRQPPSPPTCTPRERAHQHTLHTHASVVARKCVDRGPCAGPEGNLSLELSVYCGRCGAVICRCKCIFRANLTAARLRSLAPLLRYSFAPFFFLLLVVAILAGSSLGGLNFSLKAMLPKFSKMNPLSGLKRMFGIQAII